MNKSESVEYRGCTINIYYDDNPDDPRTWGNAATFVCEHRKYTLGDKHDIDEAVDYLFSSYVSDQQVIDYFVKTRNAVLVPGEDGDYSDHFYKYQTLCLGELRDHYIDADSAMGEDGIAGQMAEELGLSEKLQLIDKTGEVAMLPISMYEHSGISLWLGSKDGHPDSRWDCSSIGFAYIEKATAEEEMPQRILSEGNNTDWKQWAYDIMEDEMKTYDQYVSGEVYGYMIEDEDGEEASDSNLCGCWDYYDREHLLEDAKGDIDRYIEKKTELRKNNIHAIITNIKQIAGMTFVFGASSYHIGRDMFGYEYIEKAAIRNSLIGAYDAVDVNSLPDDLLNDIVKHIKIAA